MDEKAPQSSPITRFSVKDLPMLNRFAVSRWPQLDDKIKTEVCLTIKGTLESKHTSVKEKLQAGNLAAKIDKLNLEHEKFYTPKMTVSVESLSDEQLEEALREYEELESVSTLHTLLKAPDLDASLGNTLPMPEVDTLELPEINTRKVAPNLLKHEDRKLA
jgi:hypothetical protein